MSLTHRQIAEHFGFGLSRARQLVSEGMPTDSLESATAWRDARLLRGQRGGIKERTEINVDPGRINPDDDFEQTVERHRELKEAARQRYIVARDSSDPQEPKLYLTYQNILKTLVVVEREALARRIESKELIKTSLALDKFSRILSEVKADLLSLAIEVAPAANPDAPGTALKVVDEKVQKLLAKWSTMTEAAEDEVVGDVRITRPDIELGEEDGSNG